MHDPNDLFTHKFRKNMKLLIHGFLYFFTHPKWVDRLVILISILLYQAPRPRRRPHFRIQFTYVKRIPTDLKVIRSAVLVVQTRYDAVCQWGNVLRGYDVIAQAEVWKRDKILNEVNEIKGYCLQPDILKLSSPRQDLIISHTIIMP